LTGLTYARTLDDATARSAREKGCALSDGVPENGMAELRSAIRCSTLARVQSGARRDGIAGIYGNPGSVESATYRIQRMGKSPNPTLSAKILSFKFNNLHLTQESPVQRGVPSVGVR
jgi:hypothetical protein